MEIFLRDDVFPSWFANALTKALSVLSSQFQLVKTDNTHVQMVAGANGAAAVLSIGGLWRWIEASVTVAHPGGAAGTYPIFATAQANNITNVPDTFTDHTNYGFGLVILPPGATPVIVPGTVDVFRQVGNAIWDGTKITRVDQLAPVTPLHAGRHAVGGPDVLTPAMIGAVPSADPTVAQPGDLIVSAATSRSGCLLCDGTAYARAGATAALFAAIGTRFGAGDGSTTFNVPDYRDTVIVGASATRPLGTRGGENTHTLTVGELAVHGHGGTTGWMSANNPHQHYAHNPPINPGDAGWAAFGAGAGASKVPNNNNYAGGTLGWVDNTDINHQHGIANDGGGQAHNNMQQYAAANVFIKT